MDSVAPCTGTKVVRREGVLYSDGTTTLGGDDKSGIEAILEGVRLLLEENAAHGDIQILFTIAEEGGVNGSRCMDSSRLRATSAMRWTGKELPARLSSEPPGSTNIKSASTGARPTAGWNRKKASTQ